MTARTLRILIVDGYGDAGESLALLLRVNGHEVDVAPDGRTALRMAADKSPDVALLDLSLPDVALLDLGLPGGLDGYEVARRLREQEADKLPLLVAVTGSGRDEDRRRSTEAGIHLHLLKPIDGEALNRLLSRFKAIIQR
jgi:CheY-like chemotaxis protein